MQRRKFVIGVGALASGAAAAVGTGAFSSVTANRDVNVAVADDASAYLRLESTGGDNEEYVDSSGDGGTLSIDLSSSNPTSEGGEGVNPDAVTEIDNLFVIENQGTQPIDVDITKSGGHNDGSAVEFYPDDGDYDTTPLSQGSVSLDPGESTAVSVKVDTQGIDADTNLLDDVTFNAEA